MPFTGYTYAPGLAVLSGAVDSINKRADDDEKKQTLAALGGQVASGDFDGAAKSAFAAGDAATGLGILKMKQEAATNKMWGGIADGYSGQGAPAAPAGTMTFGALSGAQPADASTGAAAPTTPVDPKSIPAFMQTAATGVGIDPTYMARLAQVESKGDPNAQNPSGASGLFQFMPKTWAAQGLGGSPKDPSLASMAAANFTADNVDQLGNALGREPTQGEAYLAHQQGAAGALALLKNPGAPAIDALAQAYGGDRGKAAQALASNGGQPGMTAGDFASLWTGRFPSTPVRVASADPSFAPADAGVANPPVSPLALGGNAGAGAPMQMPGAAIDAGTAPQLDTGSMYRLTQGAKVNPNAPAIAYASPNDVRANPDLFFNPDRSRKTAGEVLASLSPGQSAAAAAPAASPAQSSQGTAAAAPGVDPTDQPVSVPGYKGTWTRAMAAKTDPNDTSTPDADDVAAAQKGGGAGMPAAAPMAAAPAAPVQTAQAPGAPASAPMQIQPQAVSPQIAAQLQSTPTPGFSQQRALVGMLLRDPTTRAAGIQAMMTLSKSDGWDLKTVGDQTVLFRGGANPQIVPLQGFGPKPTATTVGDTQYWLRPGEMPSAANKIGDAKSGNDSFSVVVTGEDAYGNKQYGKMNKSTGDITPVAASAAGGAPATAGGAPVAAAPSAAPTGDPVQDGIKQGLTGTAFLETLPSQLQGQVKAIVEGRAPYPQGMLLSKPMGQMLAAAVTQADPTFEAGNSTARMKVRNEFNAGGPSSPAGMITAGNTAIQHLGHLSDAAESLGNADSGIPGNNLWNSIANKTATSAGRGTSVKQFDGILGKYAEEATKFYRGTGGTESDIQRDLGNLNSDMSPTQLRVAIQTQVDLLQGKINALQDRWKQGMGPLVKDFPIIQPDSESALSKIAKRAGVAPTNTAQPAAEAVSASPSSVPAAPPASAPQPQAPAVAPKSVSSAADYNALRSGDQYTDPNGNVRTKK